MAPAFDHLTRLQREISERDDTNHFADPDEMERLSFFERAGLFHIEYYGHFYDEYPLPVFTTLCLPEVAPYIGSLSFRGPDEGGNGAKWWDFTPIMEREVSFPELRSLEIELTSLDRNNGVIVGFALEEGGQLAGWLDRAPRLERLITPSAPNAAFFERAEHPLRMLRVDAGFDHQDFILNFSQSSCFNYLHLDFGEVSNSNREFWEQSSTPFEHYQALFRSQTLFFPLLVLRNPNLIEEQLAALKVLQPRWGMAVKRTSVAPVR